MKSNTDVSRSQGAEPEAHRGGASCDGRNVSILKPKEPVSEVLLVAEHHTVKNYEMNRTWERWNVPENVSCLRTSDEEPKNPVASPLSYLL